MKNYKFSDSELMVIPSRVVLSIVLLSIASSIGTSRYTGGQGNCHSNTVSLTGFCLSFLSSFALAVKLVGMSMANAIAVKNLRMVK